MALAAGVFIALMFLVLGLIPLALAAVAFAISRRRKGAGIERSDLDDATRWLTAK